MKNCVLLATLATLVLATFSCSNQGCQPVPRSDDGSCIAWNLCNFKSLDELNRAFVDIHAKRIETDGFKVYQITNGSSFYTFVQSFNGPRGVPTFNVFCYQRFESGIILRSYVPVSEFWYRDILGEHLSRKQSALPESLSIFNEDRHTKVGYRNKIIFEVSTNWIIPRLLQK